MKRLLISLFSLCFTHMAFANMGPQGPQGPQGPSGSALKKSKISKKQQIQNKKEIMHFKKKFKNK